MEGGVFEVVGLDEAELRLVRLAVQVEDLRPLWPDLAGLFRGWMREQFESEGEFGGERWQELDDRYLAWKMENYPGKPILQASGDLRKAASYPQRIATPTSLRLRIEDPKVGYHQEGTDDMPARPLLFEDLPAPAERDLADVLDRYASRILRTAGF